jgi:hypothetical protein
MPLDQLANIAEIIAAALVIVSLFYVGLQLRQHTATAQATAGQAYAESMNNAVGLINSSSNLADILHRGANGLSNLKGGELIQFGAFLDQNFIIYETFYFQWKAGVLDARLFSIYSHAIADFMTQTGQQEWWETKHHWFDDEFQDYIKQVIAATEAKPMHPFSAEPSKAT